MSRLTIRANGEYCKGSRRLRPIPILKTVQSFCSVISIAYLLGFVNRVAEAFTIYLQMAYALVIWSSFLELALVNTLCTVLQLH